PVFTIADASSFDPTGAGVAPFVLTMAIHERFLGEHRLFVRMRPEEAAPFTDSLTDIGMPLGWSPKELFASDRLLVRVHSNGFGVEGVAIDAEACREAKEGPGSIFKTTRERA